MHSPRRFAAAGIDLERPIVTSCASGITSCVVALGLYLLGHKTAAVYDGSWAEWELAENTGHSRMKIRTDEKVRS